MEQKIKDDAVKIWRETNDGMYWVYKGRRPEKNEFVKGSCAKVRTSCCSEILETLLILRNILIVNMSLLPHGSTSKLDRQKEDSTTVDSE
ncbi:19932_t:CDS:2 [Gigaspora rosea]|nr:19932_t:CDS:2 [Gigaspora rosea]